MSPATKLSGTLLAAFAALNLLATAGFAAFTTPSGNIVCYSDAYDWETDRPRPLDARPLVCLIFEAAWQLPDDYGDDDPTCDLDRTRTVILWPDGRTEARWTCHGDVFWPQPDEVIYYGSAWSEAAFFCTVERIGVSCESYGGGTIFVSRAIVVVD